MEHANKVITYLKQDPAQIICKQLGKDENLKLVLYANTSYGNLPYEGGQLGYLVFLAGENKKCPILTWQLQRIKLVVRNSLAGETVTLSDATDNGI